MKNVFVFPCGSEIALEIARSLSGDWHFHLVGGSSIADHGRFVYDDVVEGIPWVDSAAFIPYIKNVVKTHEIDLIYPATDMALAVLKQSEVELGCYVVTSPIETVKTCLSKRKTYSVLENVIRTPKVYSDESDVEYPIFAKPDIGHSSRGVAILVSESEKSSFISKNKDILLLELLTGDEYTVDCFSDKNGALLFAGARKRARTMNGISVHTEPVAQGEQSEFYSLAEKINATMRFRGAWFAQFKRANDGELVLLEVAARFGGSSGLFRGLGVNFALLSLWDALGADVSVIENNYTIEMDRALDNRYKLGISYNEVFLDYDDTVTMSVTGLVNPKIMQMVFSCINRGIKVTLLSRHVGDLLADLRRLKIDGVFSRIIHICDGRKKSDFIDNHNAIFVDDSYAERLEVIKSCGIPVFGLDMIDALCEN